MPPKQAVNLNLSDSSTYPDILPLWRRANIRLVKPVAGADTSDPVIHPQLEPWYPRMEAALRIATRAVISSSSFFLKVLCAPIIPLDPQRRTYDPGYIPTDDNRCEYRSMMEHLSVHYHLHLNQHGTFGPNLYAEAQFQSTTNGYKWWTVVNEWFIRHYNRSGFENIPESERRIVDFVLAVTIVHEFAHIVFYYRDWKEFLAQEPYTYRSASFVSLVKKFGAWYEPCIDYLQWEPELGYAWEAFTFEGESCFREYQTQRADLNPDLTQGALWGRRMGTCNSTPARAGSLAIVDDLNLERNVSMAARIAESTMDRFLSRGCWDYVENLLRLDQITRPAQVALVKDVQLFRVLRWPHLYDWLLFVPRRGVVITQTYPQTRLQDELRAIIYAETHDGDTITDLSPIPAGPANPPGNAPPSFIIHNGVRYNLESIVQGADNASNQAPPPLPAPFAPAGSHTRRPRPSAIVKDMMESTSSEVEDGPAGKRSKSKSKALSSRLVGPRAKPKSAIQ